MPVSKITYNQNKGFGVEETFMQLVYHYVHEELVNPQYLLTNKTFSVRIKTSLQSPKSNLF
jgi:hypothetical protein